MNKRAEFHQRQKRKKRPPSVQRKSLKKRPFRTRKAANISPKTLFEQLGFHLEKHTENKWVYDNGELVYRSISYVPDLYKIFEVIFVEAADSIKRSNPRMDYLKVNIDPVKNTVSVYYNGRVLPDTHWKERVADATMLTENNFCTEFVIEIADGSRLTKKSKQVFTNSMKKKSKPKITKGEAGEDWTRLTFKPNLKKFKMAHLEDDIVALMKLRVLDMAVSLEETVEVELNDRLVRIIESFEDYALLCMKSAEISRPVTPIELALSEEKAEYRNTWNRNFESGEELILFSRADLKRSIPSMVDGLKPDQRKVLFCAFERNLYEEINVGELIGYMPRHSACHSVEESLDCTIIEMAQDFVGSNNNINLLKPIGRFGTRVFGGKDHASARWIYTKLNPVTRCLFHKDDDKLLGYLNGDEDGTRSIEPKWYIPIIPLVLVNGSGGIGAGWTSIPSYKPLDIIENVKHLLKGEDMVPMVPWYRRFKGTIVKTTNKGEYRVSGCGHMIDGQQTYKITELPIGMWTEDYNVFLESISEYKVFLESISDWSVAKDPLVEEITHNWEDYANVEIDIKIKPDKMDSFCKLTQEEQYEKFKLFSTISTNNMHLFDAEGKIKKFDSPEQILEEFFALRLPYYDQRRLKILENLEQRIAMLNEKARFLDEVLVGNIILLNCPKNELILQLESNGFARMPRKGKSAEPQVSDANDDNNREEGTWGGYEYLIFIPLIFFTKENVKKLLAKKDKKMVEYKALMGRSSREMWMMDLVELENKIEEINREEEEEEKERKRTGQTSKPKTQNENVVEAGSQETHKDDTTSLQEILDEILDEHYKPSLESEVATDMKRKVRKYIIDVLLAGKKSGSILDMTEMRTQAVRLAIYFSSCISKSSESKTGALKVYPRAKDMSKSESGHDGSGSKFTHSVCSADDSDDNAAVFYDFDGNAVFYVSHDNNAVFYDSDFEEEK